MSDLEKRYEVISKTESGAVVVMYFSDESELLESNIRKLVCKILEANGKINETGIDLTMMETKINEYILQ